ncbi:MAG: hypothetical protein Q8P91_03755 [bacterium]|nr:hypothetical protein [bacterium]
MIDITKNDIIIFTYLFLILAGLISVIALAVAYLNRKTNKKRKIKK